MRFSLDKSLLASVAVVAVAIAGCAANPLPTDGEEEAVVEKSQSALSSLESRYVGNYEWRAAESGGFFDFKSLKLAGNGRYEADVSFHLVNPNIVCFAFPCTLQEEGSWRVKSTFSGLVIDLDPDGYKPARSYYVLPPDGKSIELFRFGNRTKLFAQELTEVPFTCANVLCSPDTVCTMEGGTPSCVPQASCDDVLCGDGTVCELIDGSAQCVPELIEVPFTCANVLCSPGTVCTMEGGTPSCVPQAQTACRKTGCSGQVCADRDVITTCVYRPEFACYRTARCERQGDGQCGFTQTAELTSCLGGSSY